MKKFKIFKTFLVILTALFFSYSCGVKKNDNFDLGDIKLPKNKKQLKKIEKKESKTPVVNKLKSLKTSEDILLKIKKGRANPFLPSSQDSKEFISNLKVKGFISLNNINYALVEFQKKEGVINEKSIGGINTMLLPVGAVVKQIDHKNNKVKLLLDEKNYTLDLNDN